MCIMYLVGRERRLQQPMFGNMGNGMPYSCSQILFIYLLCVFACIFRVEGERVGELLKKNDWNANAHSSACNAENIVVLLAKI